MKRVFSLFICATMFMTARAKDEVRPRDENLIEEENPVEKNAGAVLFDVKLTENRTYKVGEGVEFIVDGNPRSIGFFSGQAGHEYEHRNGKVNPSGMFLDFKLHTTTAKSPTFFLLVSTDFDGDYSSFEGVTQQNWVDITDRFTLPSSPSYVQAGPVDLSDLAVVGKPFYFAIKYINILNSEGNRVTWTVRLPEWYSVTSSDQRELIGRITNDENTMGFQIVNENTDFPIQEEWGGTYPDRFGIRGNRNAPPNEQSWFVSKAFTGVQEAIGDPDVAIAIENAQLPKYSHVYTVPGTYTAHFVATVQDENGESREEVKEIQVVVEL